MEAHNDIISGTKNNLKPIIDNPQISKELANEKLLWIKINEVIEIFKEWNDDWVELEDIIKYLWINIKGHEMYKRKDTGKMYFDEDSPPNLSSTPIIEFIPGNIYSIDKNDIIKELSGYLKNKPTEWCMEIIKVVKWKEVFIWVNKSEKIIKKLIEINELLLIKQQNFAGKMNIGETFASNNLDAFFSA